MHDALTAVFAEPVFRAMYMRIYYSTDYNILLRTFYIQ
jgi:hypothetical protein